MYKPKDVELALRENVFGDDIPFTFDHFERPQSPPYAAYVFDVETVKADNIVVHKHYLYTLELYVAELDEDEIEERIEQFLTAQGIAFDVDTVYDADEQLYLIIYKFSL